MAAKRKHKNHPKRTRSARRSTSASTTAPKAILTPVLPTPEQAIAAVVASIAPVLFEDEVLPPGQEHRAHPRVAISVAIGLESDSHFFSGLSGDISEGGVFVQTYRDLPVGSPVEVHFELPEGELTAHGRVRWHRASSDSSPPGIGIAFETLADEDRGLIQSFCERRAPLYYDVEHA